MCTNNCKKVQEVPFKIFDRYYGCSMERNPLKIPGSFDNEKPNFKAEIHLVIIRDTLIIFEK